MKLTQQEERVLDLIPLGKEDAIKIRDIVAYTGYKPANIKYIIMHLREEFAICSGNEGYWIGDATDLIAMINNFDDEIRTKTKVVKSMRNVFERMMMKG